MAGKVKPKVIPLSPFAERLKTLREAKGLTRYALAALSGVSAQSLHKIEKLNAVPSWPTVCQLADALGVSLDAFRLG